MKVYLIAPLADRFEPETRKEFIDLVSYVDALLKEMEFSTYITYRDLLQWGRVKFKPEVVLEKSNHELKEADIVVALHPNEGIGSNIVLGMGASMKKRIIILVDTSFDMESLPGLMYRGLKKITACDIEAYDDVDDLRKKLRKSVRMLMNAGK